MIKELKSILLAQFKPDCTMHLLISKNNQSYLICGTLYGWQHATGYGFISLQFRMDHQFRHTLPDISPRPLVVYGRITSTDMWQINIDNSIAIDTIFIE